MFKLKLCIICLLYQANVMAQSGYAVNDVHTDIPVSKILNHTGPLPVISTTKDKLVVLDFFGTWCSPCIKALPKLKALQKKFSNEISILLVSEEDESKLDNFIKKQTDFTLPIIVDDQKLFTKSFQPPSYPYTVVLGKNGSIIAIPKQEQMTEDNITKWLMDEKNTSGLKTQKPTETPVLISSTANNKSIAQVPPTNNTLVQLSQEFMYAAKTGEATQQYITRLQNLSMESLKDTIKTDDEKMAFWINLYNTFTQVALKNNPGAYKSRSQFFGNKQIEIAGQNFSLDDIEHGILRRSKIKWSLGYLNKIFPGKIEKELRVNNLDYRLHFALNCGAKSCPPIAFYKPETISQQLELATKAYLTSEAEYDKDANILKLPALMGWFRKDFGGKKNMLRLLEQLSIVPAGAKPTIKFKKYDWDLFLQNYK
jgi:thiol-disulfide isomerase/thioredoxin